MGYQNVKTVEAAKTMKLLSFCLWPQDKSCCGAFFSSYREGMAKTLVADLLRKIAIK